jgi:hypothetical protein
LTERARALEPVIGALARWGYDWAWGAPREGEAIDVGAVFRSALGLLAQQEGPNGTVEMTVDERHYTLEVTRSGTTLSERAAAEADATVAGDRAAWIDALGPDCARSGLAVSGDARLAASVLDALSAAAAMPLAAAVPA